MIFAAISLLSLVHPSSAIQPSTQKSIECRVIVENPGIYENHESYQIYFPLSGSINQILQLKNDAQLEFQLIYNSRNITASGVQGGIALVTRLLKNAENGRVEILGLDSKFLGFNPNNAQPYYALSTLTTNLKFQEIFRNEAKNMNELQALEAGLVSSKMISDVNTTCYFPGM